ncbi:hypothetical protein AKJ39_04720 [candidate division MSBL1 archaeon SCGC-AAA259J03]|uniref:DUF5615 domain-containing protein n=2 Tax=candidate division MSBL1 TaxID=215777 RepID=A0A656YVH5_9EURY|nr:hypothetical protein AKJ61_02175 [candidate division MSBL1 archaeon SCGC-AAA259B11]KXA96366.1 hypothetical protein AKJ39_04720 [candidate division MSBL1 archaeon SCGC-AAA259J03]
MDINVPQEVCERLQEVGYDVIYLTEVLPGNIEDEEILRWMEDNQTPILTRDKDFPENGGDLKITITSESCVKLTRRALRKLLDKQIFSNPLLGSWNDKKDRA